MKIVEILIEHMNPIGRYNAREIAGFDDKIANRLIESGLARLHSDGRPASIGLRIPEAPKSASSFPGRE